MQILWQELKKIWNLKWCFFLLLIGGIAFYFGPLGQMNLNYLPIFESLDITLAQDLQQKYGNTLDAEEMEEVEKKYRQESEALDQKIREAYSELQELGLYGYEDLEDYISSGAEFAMEGAELEEYQVIQEQYYFPIEEKFEKEIATREYYRMLLVSFSDLQSADSQEELGILPQCIESNLGFVFQEYSAVLFLLAILFPLPYLAMDNRNRMNTMTAVTRKGRMLFRTQVCAMLLSVVALLLCLNFIFYQFYCYMLPYESFNKCSIMGDARILYWFDFNLEEYFFLMLALISILAVALAGLTMFLSFYCRTLVGIVSAVVPMYGIGILLSIYYVRNAFHVPQSIGLLQKYMMSKYMSWIIVFLLLLLMAIALFFAGRQRMRKDILE